MEGSLTDLLSFDVIRPSTSGLVGVRNPTRSLRLSIKAICEELLPEVIGLTDAFGFTDWDLDRYTYFLPTGSFCNPIYKNKTPFYFSALWVFMTERFTRLFGSAPRLNR